MTKYAPRESNPAVVNKTKFMTRSSDHEINFGFVVSAEAVRVHKSAARLKIGHKLFSPERPLASRADVASRLLQSALMMKLAFGFRWMALLLVIAFFTTLTVNAATYCVGPAATGDGSGINWSNLKVWTSTPVRGDIWYLKDGTYPGKTLSTANSGTTPITIKKALGATGQAGHGTDDGWVQSTMGTGQATISGVITINSSYWVIDGQKGAGFSVVPPDITGANYGIAMTHGATCVTIPAGSGNVTFSHIYAPGATNSPQAVGDGWFVSDGNTGSGSVDNITVSYCLLLGWGQAIRADKTWNNLMWDHNVYWLFYTDSNYHGNPINASWGAINNGTVRYSLFYKTYGSGGLSQVISANNNAWNTAKIYGNVFDQCWCGRSIISGNGHTGQGDGIYNSLVYNNTFLWSELGRPNDGGGLIGDELSSGNTFMNNLAYSCRATVGSSANDYNQYVATWQQPTESHGVVIAGSYNPFIGAAAQNYTLKTNTPAGTALAAEYATDATGRPRATWTRGAFEFGSTSVSSTNPVIQVIPSNPDFDLVAVGATKDLIFTVQNVGAGTLAFTANVSTPFSIVSGGTNSVGSNQTQTVTVRYSPTAAGNHSQTVIFSGGGGATVPVSGTAWAVQTNSSFSAPAGTINQPFVADTAGFISQSVETGVTDGGRAVYGFTVPNTGSYKISMNVNAPSEAANSLFVNVDAEPTDPTMTWDIPVTSGFADRVVAWRGAGTVTNSEFSPKIFSLTAGTHLLIIRGREIGVQLNQISIKKPLTAPPNLTAR